ncbi:basement membrane-specific heparan sulfate proteoglycan core protein, partial [Biomphalaria glabrata]
MLRLTAMRNEVRVESPPPPSHRSTAPSCLKIRAYFVFPGQSEFQTMDCQRLVGILVMLVAIGAENMKRSAVFSDDEDFMLGDPTSTTLNAEYGSGSSEPKPESVSHVAQTVLTKIPIIVDYPRYYRAAIHYSSLKYSPALEERNSREFRELAREVQRDLENLLRNLLGIHTITILHVSRGLLVTFDLGSVGEATEDEIRDTLLDSIRRGRIGNQTVSGQGFTFSKIPEVSCPSHVGRNPDKLPRSGNNWANLLVNNVFPCDGNIVGWEYYRIIPQGSAYVGVWRQDLFDSHFNLISKTELPSAPVGIREVSTNPISVKKGDFIGIFYPRTTPNNVIAQAQLADEILSSNELYQNFHIEIFDDDITQNNNLINLENIDYNTINATFSLRAVMDYEVGPTIPAIILECKPNEFNCGDDCISQDLYCDDQIDCNNESDEKDCAPEPATCPRGLFLCDDGTCQRTCNCLEGRFRCIDGTCIERVLKCNGQFNCPDGSDEGAVCQETTERQCSDEEFQCYTGTPICIPRDEECNGIPECEDKSDELPDRCNTFLCGYKDYYDVIIFFSGPTFPTVLPACPPDYVRCQDGTCRKETCD